MVGLSGSVGDDSLATVAHSDAYQEVATREIASRKNKTQKVSVVPSGSFDISFNGNRDTFTEVRSKSFLAPPE